MTKRAYRFETDQNLLESLGYVKDPLSANRWLSPSGEVVLGEIATREEQLRELGRELFGDAKKTATNDAAQKKAAVNYSIFEVPTSDIAEDLLQRKRVKLIADESDTDKQSIPTYQKNYKRIAGKFPYLPLEVAPLLDHLAGFKGKTKRTRRNEYDYLKQLYKHAMRAFGLSTNPMAMIDRPVSNKLPIVTLSLDKVAVLAKTPEIDTERVSLDLMVGHGWRPCEIIRIEAADVRQAKDGLILCHGKEREEFAPILPEVLAVLDALIPDSLPDDAKVIRSRRIHDGSTQPLQENGFRKLMQRLLVRAGIECQVYDLRRTFNQLVINAGCDEFTSERLMRHIIPGTEDRYSKYPMSRLVEALSTYSPLRLINQRPVTAGRGVSGYRQELPVQHRLGSPVLRLVETGESRTPRPEEIVQDMLQA